MQVEVEYGGRFITGLAHTYEFRLTDSRSDSILREVTGVVPGRARAGWIATVTRMFPEQEDAASAQFDVAVMLLVLRSVDVHAG